MIKRLLIVIFILVVIFGGIFGFDAFKNYKQHQAMKYFKIPPAYVSVAIAKKQNWQPYLNAIGTVTSIDSVDVTTQTSGQITGIYFHSGEFVKKGQILVQLDDSAYIAQLKQYKAQLILAEFNYKQYKKLYKEKKAVSKSSYIQALSTIKQTQALIEQIETTIDDMTIKAPFSGILGIRSISTGLFVNPGGNLVSLYTINPIYVDFSIPQNDLDKIKAGQNINIAMDAYPHLVLMGKIQTIGINVNNISRNVTVRAIVSNNSSILKPGMFVTVKALLPIEHNVITIPTIAITYNTYGDFVFVVTKKNNELIATTRYVTVGKQRNNVVIIKKGIKANEMVVTAGQLKLINGSKVAIQASHKRIK
ncbi:MAG: efflux RND transporter periplasmic adaptor subunit [Actinobacteria bacterium]|nr:efflux RND transporter periplasmic adaptor subunit [Actinomycetota bacterium]MCL5408592.1 efflux RND transporter periplasmic adaptor subunit [Candidatus Omnitrophota bacterium]